MVIKRDGNLKTFHGYMKFSKLFLSSSYILLVIYIVFFARRRRHLSERHLNIIPFRNNISTFENLDPHDRPGMINFYINLCGNIIMFIPLAIIIFSIFKISQKRTIVSSLVLLSLAIEIIQYLFNIGVADIDDVILNTCGALIGLRLNVLLQKHVFRQVTYKFT